MIWHEERDLGEVDAVVVPGGFSYGDYLRAGALARFSPAMEAVARFAAEGGPVLGICNGFQVLCESGLLPGALLTNDGIRFVCRQVELIAAQAASPFTAGIEPGERLSIPVKHESGRYFAPSPTLDQIESIGPGRLPLRAGAEPQRLEQRHSRGDQRGGQRPRPDAPPGACRGPADRLRRRAAPVRERRRSACVSAVAEREQRPSAHRELGLTDAEYGRICELLEREPNGVELAMFSLLWSEHCAYKHSRKLLRRLPSEGERVVMGPGENAGAVDIGEGYAVAFKVESHNHPSAVEPFQGAATGVGGILRDVFALGARPIAVLDSLRFGELDSGRSRYLLDGAVRGIAHYGNSIGVPTVGGEIYFEAPYEQSCLVNAMCVGLARRSEMVRAAAAGVGNVDRDHRRLDRP